MSGEPGPIEGRGGQCCFYQEKKRDQATAEEYRTESHVSYRPVPGTQRIACIWHTLVRPTKAAGRLTQR